jgi:diguanylate cyclase (GGDEF)-like protein
LFAKLKGLKVTSLSLASVTVAFALLIHFQTFWLPKQAIISYLLYVILPVTFAFSAQFNRSRISLLCFIWALFLATSQMTLPWSAWVSANTNWLILSGSSILLLIAFIKDRGLLSVHGIVRVVFILACGAFAYGWLMLAAMASTNLAQNELVSPLLPHLPLSLPLAVTALLLLWRSLRHSSLTSAAVLTSFIVWVLKHNNWIDLPWPLLVSVLIVHSLLSVIIDAYFLAYRDDLTALPSRRALNQLALSLGRKYTVAMLDIDHFKKFNDTYGHDIGDQVLRLVAAKLAKVKGGGKVFRYGGEEFTIVFPRKTIEQSQPQLEVLRQAIADYDIVVRQPERKTKKSRKPSKQSNEKIVSVTISIGVAQRNVKQSFEQALKDSDLALYRAKKNGRNNVSL